MNINNANLRVYGNVHTNQVHLGNMTVRPSYGLSTVTDVSNTTPDTIQFTNTHTAFTTTGNVTVGKELTVTDLTVLENTTLKSVYNVPATTGTQLEVYYDGRETSSYSGSGTTVTDISPNTNNGTLNGGVGFDSTYKAFTFDGTDDYIEGTVTTGTGAWSHSIAFWFKIDQIPSVDVSVFQIKDSSVADNADAADHTSPHFIIRSDGTLNNAFMGNPGNFLDDNGNQLVVQTGVWQHYVVQYNASNGGTDYRDRKLIINGNKEYYPAAGTATALNMVASNKLFIGCLARSTGFDYLFNGSIANFRLYSKVLNADQVKELYDYQKDYFLGSKSQVTLYKGHLGVGVTEPSGQLELAGDERIQEYPPRGMTDFDTYIEGHGVFTASASSVFSSGENRQAYQAFNGGTDVVTDDAWISKNDRYTSGLPNANAALINGVAGEWLGIQFPYPIKLKQIAIQNRAGAYNNRSPDSGILWGSNDGTEYEQVVSWNGLVFAQSSSQPSYVTINATNTYRFFRLQTTKLVTTASDFVAIGELKFFGTPGPTTLDKGSLTLGRSLDVPRVSRYDVDTETPRPEKLLVDFDTTVNSSPTDISGQGNHGTFYNGASYSAADKAFKFVGVDNASQTANSSDTVRGTHGLSGTQPVHSHSVWFKQTTDATDYTWVCAAGTAANQQQSAVLLSGNSSYPNRITFDCFNGWVTSTVTAQLNRWYHVVVTFNGGANFNTTNCRIYVDGVDCTGPESEVHNGTATFNLQGAILALGSTHAGTRGLTGLVSNYKLYNVVLEPTEVRIGKAPEAQLDVRGTANFGSRVGIGIENVNPQRPLHVSGDSWVTGVMYDGYIANTRARSVKKYVNGVNVASLSTTFKLGDPYRGGILKVYMTSGVSGADTTATVMYGVWGFNWGGGTNKSTRNMAYYESQTGNSTSVTVASDGVLTITGTMYSSFSYPLMEVEVYYAGGIFVDY